jgi:hypothetical protein
MNVKNQIPRYEKNMEITTNINDSQIDFDYTKNVSPFAVSDSPILEEKKSAKLDNLNNHYMRLTTKKQKFLFTSQKDEYCKMVYKNTELYCHCRILIDKLTELWVLNGMPKLVPKKILNLSYKTYYALFNNWYDSTYPLIDVPSWILQNYQKYNSKKKKACKKRVKKYKEELIDITWHPKRFLNWIDPIAKKRWG